MEPSKYKVFRTFWEWTLQLGIWFTLVTLFFQTIFGSRSFNWEVLTLLIYSVYLINSFLFSQTFLFLKNIVDMNFFEIYIHKLFRTPISKKFIVDEESKFCQKNEFMYSTCRDVSGTLDLRQNAGDRKPYIRLSLDIKILFADNETMEDHFTQEREILHEYKVERAALKEHLDIPGYMPYFFISVSGKRGNLINQVCYIICSVIPIVELYKMYVASKSCVKDFAIVKMVSTRNNLYEMKYSESLSPKDPKVQIQYDKPEERELGNKHELVKYDNNSPYEPLLNRKL